MRPQKAIFRIFAITIFTAAVSVSGQEPPHDEIILPDVPVAAADSAKPAADVRSDLPTAQRTEIAGEPEGSVKRGPNLRFALSLERLRNEDADGPEADKKLAKFLERYDPGFVETPVKRQAEKNFNWKGAVWQSLFFLGIQHGVRLTEEKTRRELDGPFFRDWKESVKNLEGWDDGGKFFTNYIAHPLQGAATSRIFLNNHASGNKAEFGDSKEYWESRLKALAWSAVWSLQFEIGPISEASIGNVGQKRHLGGESKLTWGDIVVTPVGGFVFNIAEDIIDKYVLKRWIEKGGNDEASIGRKIIRSFFTPLMSFTNLLRMRMPWYRDHRRN